MTAALRAAIEDAHAMNIDVITRREALCTLAALPVATLGKKPVVSPSHYDEMLRHCTAALEGCWQLYRSSDPIGTKHAFGCCSTYVPLLKTIAHNDGYLRKQALHLAAKYAILQVQLGWNRVGGKESVIYAREALDLGKASGSILLQLSAYSKLSYTCLLCNNYTEAWKVMQEGEYVLKSYQKSKKKRPLPSGIIGNFYSGYSLVQADNGLDPDSALGIATDSEPLDEPVAFIEFTRFDQRFEAASAWNSKGDPVQAMHWLDKLIDLETLVPRHDVPQSEGERVTSIITLTRSLLQSKDRDLEKIVKFWKIAIEGAKALRAEEKYRQAITNFEMMKMLYPREQAIRKLIPLTEHW
jgi:hypothetical protein